LYVKMDYTRADEVLVKVAADRPPVPLGHLIRQDCATTALDLYGHALCGADLSSPDAVERVADALDKARAALAEFAKLALAGNADTLDRAIRKGLWDEGVRSLHDQLLTLLRQQQQAGA